MKTNNHTKYDEEWLGFSGTEYNSYIRYDDIAAFQYKYEKKQLKVFVKGVEAPFIFNFDTLNALCDSLNAINERLHANAHGL